MLSLRQEADSVVFEKILFVMGQYGLDKVQLKRSSLPINNVWRFIETQNNIEKENNLEVISESLLLSVSS